MGSSRTRKACDRCRSKKSKCDGRHPCTSCVSNQVACAYSARRRHEAKDRYSQMQSVIDEGFQKLFKACIDSKSFPGTIPEPTDGRVTTEEILRGLGLIAESVPQRGVARSSYQLEASQTAACPPDVFTEMIRENDTPLQPCHFPCQSANSTARTNSTEKSQRRGVLQPLMPPRPNESHKEKSRPVALDMQAQFHQALDIHQSKYPSRLARGGSGLQNDVTSVFELSSTFDPISADNRSTDIAEEPELCFTPPFVPWSDGRDIPQGASQPLLETLTTDVIWQPYSETLSNEHQRSS